MKKKNKLEEICEYAVPDMWNKAKYNCKLVGYTDYACIRDNPEDCELYIEEKRKKNPVFADGLYVP